MNAPKAGTKLLDSGSGVEAIVVKPPSEPGLEIAAGESSVLGKRYTCGRCNAEVLVTRGGDAGLRCHSAAMVLAQPKTLPSSD